MHTKYVSKPLSQTASTPNLHIPLSYVALPNRFCLKYANNTNGTPFVFLCTAYERAVRLLGSLMYLLYLHKRKMLLFDPSCFHVMVYKILIAVRCKYANNQIYPFALPPHSIEATPYCCSVDVPVLSCNHNLLFGCMRRREVVLTARLNGLVWRNVRTCGFSRVHVYQAVPRHIVERSVLNNCHVK